MCRGRDFPFSSLSGLRASGWTRAAIRQALQQGSLVRVRRGVYRQHGACAEAITAVAHGGTLTCVSAARHAGLWVLNDPGAVHVGMRASDHHYPHNDCVCVAHWDDRPTADSFGLPSIPRILRQILGCCGVEEFFVALESALRLGRIDADGLQWLHAHTGALGREALALARSDADSGLESLVRWRLRAHGLAVRTQVGIYGVGVVDLLIGERLIVETDGKDNHHDEHKRHKDLVRDANAAGWGYVTLRFDYALVVYDWDLVERAILGQIAAGHHLALPAETQLRNL